MISKTNERKINVNTTNVNEDGIGLNYVLNYKKGITLISLVITIVVLLILATVAISMAINSDGLFAKAEKAKEEWNKKVAEEETTINDILQILDPKTFVDADKDFFMTTIKFDADGNKIEESEDTVPKITIPAGFKVKNEKGGGAALSISDVENGVVIVDGAGNEFVWVPCTEGEYKKHTYTEENDKGKNVEDTGEAGWNTYCYRSYNDWTDAGSGETQKESVKKYGGFYIARYEAGVPENADFYVNSSSEPKTYAIENKKNTTTYTPVSKKGMQAWNYISQINAKTVSANMYGGSSSVISQLVDGVAWDTTVEWIAKDESLSDAVKKGSTTKGNYANNSTEDTKIIESNILFAEHLMRVKNGKNDGWCLGKNYQVGQFTSGWNDSYTVQEEDKSKYDGILDNSEGTTYTYKYYAEMSTGASDNTKLKNIYDLGGNMYEWTTETGFHKEGTGQPTTTEYDALRGGSFNSNGSDCPVSLRDGNNASAATVVNIGFRVVLYVK